MANKSTKHKLPSLKKWQKSAVKLGLYSTKEIRGFNRLSDLPQDQQHLIRVSWTPSYKKQKSIEAHNKAVETRKQRRDDRIKKDLEETRRIEEFVRNTPPVFDENGNLNTERYITEVYFHERDPRYIITDKETGEIVGDYGIIKHGKHAEIAFMPYENNGQLSSDSSKIKTQEQLAIPDYDLYLNTPYKSDQWQPDYSEDAPKTSEEYISDMIDEILDVVGDEQIRKNLKDFISKIREENGDDNIKDEDGNIKTEFYNMLSEFAEKAVYYSDDDVGEYYEEIYVRMTGKEPDDEMSDFIRKTVESHVDIARPLREERQQYRRQNMASIYEKDMHTSPVTGAPKTLPPAREQIVQNIIQGILRGEVTYSRKLGTRLVKK